MTTKTSRVLIFTYKDGLLARLAHDLQVRCERFELALEGENVNGRFALASLRVDGAREHGELRTTVLSAGDRQKIEKTMVDEVLDVRHFGEAAFSGTASRDEHGGWIDGKLTLHGRTLPLPRFRATHRDARCVVEVSFAPSAWGIAPYRALAGALKLQDRVTVRIELEMLDTAVTSMRWAHDLG